MQGISESPAQPFRSPRRSISAGRSWRSRYHQPPHRSRTSGTGTWVRRPRPPARISSRTSCSSGFRPLHRRITGTSARPEAMIGEVRGSRTSRTYPCPQGDARRPCTNLSNRPLASTYACQPAKRPGAIRLLRSRTVAGGRMILVLTNDRTNHLLKPKPHLKREALLPRCQPCPCPSKPRSERRGTFPFPSPGTDVYNNSTLSVVTNAQPPRPATRWTRGSLLFVEGHRELQGERSLIADLSHSRLLHAPGLVRAFPRIGHPAHHNASP